MVGGHDQTLDYWPVWVVFASLRHHQEWPEILKYVKLLQEKLNIHMAAHLDIHA